jgi:uncharacterized damage-inducible protein DinB
LIQQAAWTSRHFDHALEVNLFPAVLERFRSTPGRIDEAFSALPDSLRTARPNAGWSIQEHLGHLLDLEELGERRLQDYQARAPVLVAADMSNRKTHEADHNSASWSELLDRFRAARAQLVQQLEALPLESIAHNAQHPRLQRPMNVVEWVYFMCEHDDHHLAKMRELTTS